MRKGELNTSYLGCSWEISGTFSVEVREKAIRHPAKKKSSLDDSSPNEVIWKRIMNRVASR